MERWSGRVALVTGAGSGMGAAIAEKLVKHGMIVVGADKDIKPIQDKARLLKDEKGSLHAVQVDVTKEEQILAMFDRLKKEHGGADICVNNAGLAHAAPLLSGDTAQWRNMLEVNVLGPSICTREAIQSMRERNIDDGHIVHMGSMSGQRMLRDPDGHFYYCTKYAVRALTEGHRNELRALNSHIRITEISPGLVVTNFAPRMRGEEVARKLYDSFTPLQPEDVADAAMYVLSAPPHVQVHDILMRSTEQID